MTQDAAGFQLPSTVQQGAGRFSFLPHHPCSEIYRAHFPTCIPFLTSNLCTVHSLPHTCMQTRSLFPIKLILTFVLGVKWDILFRWLQQRVMNTDWQDRDEKTVMPAGSVVCFMPLHFNHTRFPVRVAAMSSEQMKDSRDSSRQWVSRHYVFSEWLLRSSQTNPPHNSIKQSQTRLFKLWLDHYCIKK